MLKDGYLNNIYYRYWKTDKKEIANIFSIHGLGGHCIWFDNAAGLFNQKGISYFSFDLPGFGQSKYKKGTIDSYDTWVSVTKETIENFLVTLSVNSPVFILGHSLGALIAILLSENVKANGWILSVPGFEGKKELWPFFKVVLPILTKAVITPDENIALPFGPELLTKNKETQIKIKKDPYRIINPSAALLMQVYLLSNKTKKINTLPKDPTLVLVASEDKICSNTATEDYFEKLINPNKCMKAYTNFFHDLFVEDDLSVLVDDISAWIVNHNH